MRQRYFLGLEGDQWPDGFREVSVERWIEAERTAGFHGPAGTPATGGFSGHGVVGHVEYRDDDLFLEAATNLVDGWREQWRDRHNRELVISEVCFLLERGISGDDAIETVSGLFLAAVNDARGQ